MHGTTEGTGWQHSGMMTLLLSGPSENINYEYLSSDGTFHADVGHGECGHSAVWSGDTPGSLHAAVAPKS